MTASRWRSIATITPGLLHIGFFGGSRPAAAKAAASAIPEALTCTKFPILMPPIRCGSTLRSGRARACSSVKLTGDRPPHPAASGRNPRPNMDIAESQSDAWIVSSVAPPRRCCCHHPHQLPIQPAVSPHQFQFQNVHGAHHSKFGVCPGAHALMPPATALGRQPQLKTDGRPILREFCGKSDAAFGGCGFFGGCAPPKQVIPGSVRDLW